MNETDLQDLEPTESPDLPDELSGYDIDPIDDEATVDERASPPTPNLSDDELAALRAVALTPVYERMLADEGLPSEIAPTFGLALELGKKLTADPEEQSTFAKALALGMQQLQAGSSPLRGEDYVPPTRATGIPRGQESAFRTWMQEWYPGTPPSAKHVREYLEL